jgi:ATPase subunit of ABC transporter with duplicated ATPase domains
LPSLDPRLFTEDNSGDIRIGSVGLRSGHLFGLPFFLLFGLLLSLFGPLTLFLTLCARNVSRTCHLHLHPMPHRGLEDVVSRANDPKTKGSNEIDQELSHVRLPLSRSASEPPDSSTIDRVYQDRNRLDEVDPNRYARAVIRLDNIGYSRGKQILFLEASAAIQRGEKIGLIGPNGAGKSTLFRMIMKEEEPDEGQVMIDRGVTLGYFSQDVGDMSGRPVVAEVMAGAGVVAEVGAELAHLEQALANTTDPVELDRLVNRFGEVQSRFDELDGYALDGKARAILSGLGFEQDQMDADVGKLSGGWKMRVALARILLLRPNVMLLDEPSNHLDLESLIWLEGFLADFEGALLMTSHDREFMNRVVNKIIEIDAGELTTYTGDYDFYEQQRAISERQAQAQYERQQAMLAKESRFIERFKAQAAKAAQVQSRIKKLDKIEKVEPPKTRETLVFKFKPAARSGDDVARFDQVKKAYGQRVIYNGLDLLLRRGERWCVMGVNGAGKSTLLKMIAGQTEPDSGQVTVGASVKMGYFAQHAMDQLAPERTVWEMLVESFPLATIGSLRSLAGCFGFSGDDVEKPCRVLSGGEKARLILALMLFDPPNFLVLDEPTNHLDLATKEMLLQALADFQGTMLFVSHDRRFLGALSNRVLELTPKGIQVFTGGYTEYVALSGHEAPGLRPL